MKKIETKKFSFEKFELVKLKNGKFVFGGSDITKDLTQGDNDTDLPVRPLTTI